MPEWKTNKYPGKNLIKNVSVYVKRRHKYIVKTNFLEKGEEKNARKAIREYLYRYLPEIETGDSDSDSEDTTTNETTKMTYVCIIMIPKLLLTNIVIKLFIIWVGPKSKTKNLALL